MSKELETLLNVMQHQLAVYNTVLEWQENLNRPAASESRNRIVEVERVITNIEAMKEWNNG